MDELSSIGHHPSNVAIRTYGVRRTCEYVSGHLASKLMLERKRCLDFQASLMQHFGRPRVPN